MKKILILLLLFCTGYLAKAQDGYTFLGIRGGWVVEDSYTATINLDISGKYYSSFEIYGEYYKNTTSEYESYMGGVVFKPALTRNKNSLLRLRLGAGIGAGNDKFLASPQIGLEFSQALFNNIDILLINRNQFVFFDDKSNRWRVGLELGFRIPI